MPQTQLFFGTDHSNQLPTVFKQYIHGDRFIIGPPIAQSDNIELVYPFPTWDERVFVSVWNRTWFEIASSYVELTEKSRRESARVGHVRLVALRRRLGYCTVHSDHRQAQATDHEVRTG